MTYQPDLDLRCTGDAWAGTWVELIRYTLKDVEIKDVELNMAEQLVDSLANEFNTDRYRDTYQEELRELIAAKAAGEEITPAVAQEEAPEDVSDLLAKLEASVAKKKVGVK